MPNRAAVRPHSRIRQARNHAKLSQSQLAEHLQLHRSAVSQWESPRGVSPTIENLIKLARLTEVQIEWLATGRGRMQYEKDLDDSPSILHDYVLYDHDEADLLKNYRVLSSSVKKIALLLVKALADKK